MPTKRGVTGERRAITSSGGLFGEFFRSARSLTFHKDSLLDGRARRLFDLTRRACEAGAYPYQLPLETRTGPWVEAEGRRMLMLSSYDYLGLIGDERVDAAAIEAIRRYGTGTGGVRMLTGTLDLHHEMEHELADFKGTSDAITFSSGYLANLAAIASVLSAADTVVMDALAHRSLADACKLAGVTVRRYAHNDCNSLCQELEASRGSGRTLIVADGVFSMDGDICVLPELVTIKKAFGCYLLVDESHALGVIGATGRGTDEHFGVATEDVDLWTGSLAKGIPSNGGFIAASQELSIYLQHAAAPFIFSAALCPAASGAVLESLAILRREPERVDRLQRNARFLREGLRALGYDTGKSETAVIPVILKDEAVTTLFAARMREMGIMVTPVMFPAVAQGMARLRLCATAAHSESDLEFALEVFSKLRNAVGSAGRND
ncbi:MAG TPA: pyridoxal phosphate-dependent aminotransferase family protein [Bryobacteraceae bacterium]|nr:pyridoxal phosphate-dependent aminotransferase family protein [Bryobacteraceae bacterium]